MKQNLEKTAEPTLETVFTPSSPTDVNKEALLQSDFSKWAPKKNATDFWRDPEALASLLFKEVATTYLRLTGPEQMNVENMHSKASDLLVQFYHFQDGARRGIAPKLDQINMPQLKAVAETLGVKFDRTEFYERGAEVGGFAIVYPESDGAPWAAAWKQTPEYFNRNLTSTAVKSLEDYIVHRAIGELLTRPFEAPKVK